MILIIGIPNAGKTTYSMQYENVVHLDNFTGGKYKKCIATASNLDNACVEGVFHQRSQRERLLEAVKEKGERNICIWLDTPIEECLRRERESRKRPDMITLNLFSSFQPPTLDEGWDEIQIIKWQPEGESTVTVLHKEVQKCQL